MFTSALLFFFACGDEDKQDTAVEAVGETEETQVESEDTSGETEESEDTATEETGGEE